MKKLSVSMPNDLYDDIQQIMRLSGMKNRSEIIGILLRAGLESKKRNTYEQILPNTNVGQ